MSRPKVLYFTAAAAPTGPEQAAIDALLPSTSAIVSDAQELTVGGSTYTFTVVDGAITAIAVA